MRNLIFSLYVGVFLALMGLGWAIDEYYSREFEDTEPLPYQGYRELLNLTAEILADRLPDRAAMQQFLDQHENPITLEPIEAVPLPDGLIAQRVEVRFLSCNLMNQIPFIVVSLKLTGYSVWKYRRR